MTAAERFAKAKDELQKLEDEGYDLGVPVARLQLSATGRVKEEAHPPAPSKPKIGLSFKDEKRE